MLIRSHTEERERGEVGREESERARERETDKEERGVGSKRERIGQRAIGGDGGA